MAFPLAIPEGVKDANVLLGLTKREFFAAVALGGLLANPREVTCDVRIVAEAAFQYADALIKEGDIE